MRVAEAHRLVAEPTERRLQHEHGGLRLVLRLGVGRGIGTQGVAAEEVVGESDSRFGEAVLRAGEPPEDGLRNKTHAEARQDAVAHAPRDPHDVRRARALAGDDRQGVARREPTGPSASPRANPARSMSHAAASFTRAPSGSGHRGIAGSPATASMRAASATGTIGFTKNEPQLRRFASPGSRTIDFARRIARTLARTSASDGASIPRAARCRASSA